MCTRASLHQKLPLPMQGRELEAQPSRAIGHAPSPEQAENCCYNVGSGWGKAEAPANSTVETKKFQAIDFLTIPLHRDRSSWNSPQEYTLPYPPRTALDPTTPTARAGTSSTRTHSLPSKSPGEQLEPIGGRRAQPGTSHTLQQILGCFCSAKTKVSPACKGSSRSHTAGIQPHAVF